MSSVRTHTDPCMNNADPQMRANAHMHTRMLHAQHAHTHTKSLELARHSPSQGLYSSCSLCPGFYLAHSLNSCLKCRPLEALPSHTAVDSGVPRPGSSRPLLHTLSLGKQSRLASSIPLPLTLHCWAAGSHPLIGGGESGGGGAKASMGPAVCSAHRRRAPWGLT